MNRLSILCTAAALALCTPAFTAQTSAHLGGTFGADGIAQFTERIDLGPGGVESDGQVLDAMISADGRFVAFSSDASNLVPGDTNQVADVFVVERATGAVERVSVDSLGVEGNGDSLGASISHDGRYVVFSSAASNLVSGDLNGQLDVFLHDRQTGETTRISVGSWRSDGVPVEGNGPSCNPRISWNGTTVVFESLASNLVVGDRNGVQDIFLHTIASGNTKRVSQTLAGVEANGPSFQPSIAKRGHVVAFSSLADNLVSGDTNGVQDVFVRDYVRADLMSPSVAGDGPSGHPSLAAHSEMIAFESQASNLVPQDTNGVSDVFLYDFTAGTMARLSETPNGVEGNGASTSPVFSMGNQTVAFLTEADNLVPNDLNGVADVVVYNTLIHALDLRSTSTGEDAAGAASQSPSISQNGQVVVFTSDADNLVQGDFNGFRDLFSRSSDYLTADRSDISAAVGGVIVGTVDFPISEAGYEYAVLISRSGTGPTQVGNVSIPLTNDLWFQKSLNGNLNPFKWAATGGVGSQTGPNTGLLDPNGDAVCLFFGSPGSLHAHIGYTFNAVAVSYDPATTLFRLVSSPIPVDILP